MPDFTILIPCVVKSTLLEVDAKKEDVVVTTKFGGIANKGLFANFNPDLEDMVFDRKCFKGMNTGEVSGKWTMKLYTEKMELICELDNCVIKNISLNVNTSDGNTYASFKITHGHGVVQNAIESAISATVMLRLSPDRKIMGGAFSEPQESSEEVTTVVVQTLSESDDEGTGTVESREEPEDGSNTSDGVDDDIPIGGDL